MLFLPLSTCPSTSIGRSMVCVDFTSAGRSPSHSPSPPWVPNHITSLLCVFAFFLFPGEMPHSGEASGFVVHVDGDEGLVLTNRHVAGVGPTTCRLIFPTSQGSFALHSTSFTACASLAGVCVVSSHPGVVQCNHITAVFGHHSPSSPFLSARL